MKVYTCTTFDGHWPVGTAAVVVAETREAATVLLERELARVGLVQQVSADDLQEVDLTKAQTIILNDGDY